jgi:CDP-glucose 4,6-dehydratase
VNFNKTYHQKSVLVTGHTGFKGSWLCEWLLQAGAKVVGYALDPPTEPSHFALTKLSGRLLNDIRADINEPDTLREVFQRYRPDFVFHLAAQPLVRNAYHAPLETVQTNILGTVNILEAIRNEEKDCVGIMVTTDKVYEQREWTYSYRESDPLGGHDPYSASKACADMLVCSWQRSFFTPLLQKKSGVHIGVAPVRAGNVIGGGDWAADRIVPDCIRSLSRNVRIPVRNKNATRPWQHVLEPLSGYLLLAAKIHSSLHSSAPQKWRQIEDLCSPYNFGPLPSSHKTVLDLVQELCKYWKGSWYHKAEKNSVHEAQKLQVAIDKASHHLGWYPVWDFETAVEKTAVWYYGALHNMNDPGFIHKMTLQQISEYHDSITY